MDFKKIISSSVVAGVLMTTSMLANTDVDKVYATVNGESIKASDIAVVLKDPRMNFDTLPEVQKKQILDQLVNKKLIAKKALSSDIVNGKLYKTTLENSIVALKENLALQMWVGETSKKISVSDKEIQDFYNQNKSNFKKPAEFKARHILVKTEDAAKKIVDTLNKSKDLKNDFIKLAKEKSTGPSGKNGGDLGWFDAKKMVPEFSLATSFLKKGTITKNPVKTQFGYHVIYLEDKKDAQMASLEEVKNDLKQLLSQEAFNKKLDAIIQEEKSKAKIIYK
jgi:parvulin-like peptidyl-prolyl isomerase